VIEISDKEKLNDEDFELLKDLFGKSEEQKDSIKENKDFMAPKRKPLTDISTTKVMVQIDDNSELIAQTKLFDNKQTIRSERIKKKIKKKELLSQIYDSIPLIRENNILLKELLRNLQTLDFKFKSLIDNPIKIKVIK
jgi:hypothetical protein